MKIELKEITIKELAQDYKDNLENGVVGFGGKLDIRPPYQREFVYNDSQRQAVINTLIQDFPLNVMYWAVKEDGNYELIDGQQRTISICQYINGDFSHNGLSFHNLQNDQQEQILNYKLMIYLCEGKDSEKLKWFETINIAGEKLTNQELRNAIYSGTWLMDAKKYFSKTNCVAYQIGSKYIKGSPIRQEYLEATIKWISNNGIEKYMSKHQHDENASELWQYFQQVINWIEIAFPKYRKEMKGLEWGFLYNEFKDKQLNAKKLEEEITKLMQDDDVKKKSGIYPYVLTRKEKYLNLRAFSETQKRTAYERQDGKCAITGEKMDISQMEADHITPWHLGGKTELSNLQMISKEANRRKGGK